MVEKRMDGVPTYRLAAEDRKKSAAGRIGAQDMNAGVPTELCQDQKRMPGLDSG